jgi:hypothetical protein
MIVLTAHGSRTTTKLPPIAVHDNNQSRQSLSQPAVPSFYSASTSQASRSPQDAPRSLTPINSHRQDSAIFQHRTETAKEAQALGPLSDVVANSSLQSPDDSQRSISPRSNSYPTTPSSPQPSHQGQSRSGMQAQSRGNSKHRPSSNHKSPASGDNDHSTISNTRQQRYNVRFNQIYTSDNMPPSQKPRNDPLAATPVSTEATEPQPKTPDRPVTPTAMPSMVPGLPSLDEQSQTQQRADDSSVERCKYCNEIWRRPLPDLDQYQSQGEDVPAQTTHDIARNSMNLIARLRNIGTQADLAYDRWCYKHRFCVPPPEGMRPPSPPVTEPQGDLHSTSAHGPRRDSRITDMSVNNKRKSDQPHDNDRQINSKSRKVTFKT